MKEGQADSTPLPAFGPDNTAESFSYGATQFCKQMQSFDEAYLHLQECGLARLDGNSNRFLVTRCVITNARGSILRNILAKCFASELQSVPFAHYIQLV